MRGSTAKEFEIFCPTMGAQLSCLQDCSLGSCFLFLEVWQSVPMSLDAHDSYMIHMISGSRKA